MNIWLNPASRTVPSLRRTTVTITGLIEGIVIILLGVLYLIGGIVTDKIIHSVLAICLILLGISYLKRR